MKELLNKFTEDYILKAENSQLGKDERRIINNPIVYLFIGDQSVAALKALYQINQRKWSNHDGIIYLHVYMEETWKAENVYSFQASDSYVSGKRSRPSLFETFYQNEQKLVEYNQLLRQINVRFSEMGMKFNSFQKVNISAITYATDSLNVILPGLTILLEHSLQEVFTMQYLDAFCLIEERAVEEETAALGLSFLNELNDLQQHQFSFSKEIRVTKDKIRMTVTHNGPLFNLVYLLSDKDERGMFPEDSMETNFEIISTINMMKNKRVNENEHFNGNQMYNDVQFTKNIQNEYRIPAFVTAGFSKVARPNEAIVMNVLYYFIKHLIMVIRDRHKAMEEQKVFEMLELDAPSIERTAQSFFPSSEKIEEMLALMPSNYKYSDLKNVTLKEAEELLFGQSAKDFFQENVMKPAMENSRQFYAKHYLRELLTKRVEENPKYGVYSAYQWTDEQYVKALLRFRAEFSHQAEVLEEELNQAYSEYGSQQNFSKVILFEKTNTRNFISHILKKIYSQKWNILTVKSKLELVNHYIKVLEDCHVEYKHQIKAIEGLEYSLHQSAIEVISGYNNKINQNIPEYYERAVETILRELTEKRTADFYFEDKNLAGYSLLLKQGSFATRVLEMCQRLIFESGQLDQSFEQEILARGNVRVAYGDPQVLTKEELFSELYQLLEKDSACKIHLLEYAQKHKYEEKYYFGDYQSSFIQYALAIDKDNRPYRLGCIHENRTSGIEKLSLMGGFAIEDLRFYKNNVRYYEKYQENGFEFHPETASALS
jgi:hypothetical protein